MQRPAALFLVITVLVAGTTAAARAEDGLFGNMLGATAGSSPPARGAAPEGASREREARQLRREYWERERARIEAASAARERPAATLASR